MPRISPRRTPTRLLFKKADGQPARLGYLGHVLLEHNRPQSDDGKTRTTVTLHGDAHAGDPRFLREMLRSLADLRGTFRLDSLDWSAIAAAADEASEDEEETP